MDKIRTYGLSEAVPLAGMDRRIFFLSAALFVLTIILGGVGCVWHVIGSDLFFAPTALCALLAYESTHVGKKMWKRSPWFLDEVISEWRTPKSGPA